MREGADDLSVSGSAGGDVEVVNVNPNLAIDLTWDGRQHAVDGEYASDVGPSGGGGAACDDASAGVNAAADCAAER